ncbi:hypothetical protein T09_9813 [Trichinella sp. T9]|nr:hypothetical protein T09_9813 [Trichinella sp. T9]
MDEHLNLTVVSWIGPFSDLGKCQQLARNDNFKSHICILHGTFETSVCNFMLPVLLVMDTLKSSVRCDYCQ